MTRKLDAFVDDLLSIHPGDPANARYLAPLEGSEQEAMARAISDVIYSARSEYFSDKITQERADRV
jgi:hypothetical protein